MRYPCTLCGSSPDLGQAHTPTCPTQHVYDDYEAARRARHIVPIEHTLNVGAAVSVAGLVAAAVLLVALVQATKDDDGCVTHLGSDGVPVAVCLPEAPKTRHGS